MKTFGQILKAIKGDNVTIWDYCAPHHNAQGASVRIYFDDMEKDTREVFHVYLATGRVEHASIWGYDREKNNWRGYREQPSYTIHRSGHKALSDFCRDEMYKAQGRFSETFSHYKKPQPGDNP